MELANLGKILLIIGGLIVLTGLVLLAFGKIGLIGKLPGDLLIQRAILPFIFLW